MKTFLESLIRLGVSKVSLLFIAILWLLERLGPGWPLFLESPQLVVNLQGACLFVFFLHCN